MILSNVWKFSRFSSQFALLIHQFFQCEILPWLVAEVRVLCHKQGYFVYETAPLKKPWYTEIMIQVIQKYNSFIDCSDWLPSGNSSILLWISAEAAASLTSTSEESTLPYAILYLIVSLNKTVSWGTTPMHWRNDLWLTCGSARHHCNPHIGGRLRGRGRGFDTVLRVRTDIGKAAFHTR